MELSIVYPPNKPLERFMNPSESPTLYKFLLYIETNANGQIILGCSNIAGSFWEGTLFYYNDFQAAKENLYSSYYISSSTSDANFIQDNCVLLAEETGVLKLLNIPSDETSQLMECTTEYDKEYRVVHLSVWNANRFATCSDQFINVYKIRDGISIQLLHSYEYYHTGRITWIDVNKSDDNLFISTSADRKACLWDVRMPVPATVIYNNEFSSLTSASWNPVNKDHVVIGSEAGDAYMIDIKQPKEVLCVTHCCDSKIHRIRFDENEHVAVCGDSPLVLIYDCKNGSFKNVYRHVEHNSIVRGLSWYKSNLYSCGFNKKMASHRY